MDSENEKEAEYARQCLMARRLVERGVRFVELSCCSVGIGSGGAGVIYSGHCRNGGKRRNAIVHHCRPGTGNGKNPNE